MVQSAAPSRSAGEVGIGLLERSQFRAVLDASLASAADGRGRVVLVSGEAGIGKSALIRQFCDSPRAGVRVLWGACDALQTPRPLSPFTDIAAQAKGGVLTAVRNGEKPHGVFLALVDELKAPPLSIAVLEDVHWADEATLDIVRLLARRAEMLGAMVIATYRDDELDVTHPLRLAVGELGTAPGVVQLRLPPLSLGAVEVLSRSHEVDAEQLYLTTGGNPFFVTEVLAGGDMAVPPTVRDAVLARTSRLGAAARDVLEAVAVVPPNAEMWLLDEVVPHEIVHLDACLAAGLLHATGRNVSFRHELARRAVEESIGPYRSRELHARVLNALEHSPQGATDAARLAHHAEAGGAGVAALRYATTAAESATSLGAHREAAAQYRRAVRFAGSLPPAEQAELFQRLSFECYLTDQCDEAVEAIERARACYREVGDRPREAAMLCALSGTIWCPGRIEEAVQAGTDAVTELEALEPGRELALAYANLSALALWEDIDTAVAWGTRARALAERLEEGEIARYADVNLDVVMYGNGAVEHRERLEQALELADQAGLEGEVGRIWVNLAWGASRQRCYADVDRYVEAGLAHCRERDLELWQRYLRVFRARAALDRARWSEATDDAWWVLHDPGPSVVPRIWSLVVLGSVRARRGDPRPLEPLDRALALAAPRGLLDALAPVAAARAETAWLEGRDEAVAGETDAALELAVRLRAWRDVGELARWRWRVGVREPVPNVSGPDAATVAGDWKRAAELWDELGCPYESALACCDADDDDALQAGLAELHALGARPAAAIAAQRLRRRGVRHVPRGPYGAARENAAGLTSRELDVLALVSEGLRNAEIAARLVVSPRTVDHHVSAVLRKLGARTRGEAAAIGVRDGLTSKDG